MNENVSKLIKLLKTSPLSEFEHITKNISLTVSDVDKYTNFSPDFYTRNLIYSNSLFEVMLLCWGPGQETPVHDHDSSKCWVYALSGSITEKIYQKKIIEIDTRTPSKMFNLTEGDSNFIEDEIGVHSIHNFSQNKAMSLHIYSPPIKTCRYFKEDLGTMDEKVLSFHSYPEQAL